MKEPKTSPSLDDIQQRLFAPSYALVKIWVETPEALDNEIIKQLEASTLAQQEKEAYQQSQEPVGAEIVNALFTTDSSTNKTEQTAQIPDAIKQLIQQRSEVAKHCFSQSPSEGLIVFLGKGDDSASDLNLAMASPLVVILNKPSNNKNIWDAWMVAAETDYASDWDMLLDAHIDTPLDPLVGMVQVWNPVRIYLPLIEKSIGELKPERLATLRKLANAYQANAAINHTEKTSTLIKQYQKMYAEVATFITKKAVITKSPFECWKTAFLAQTEKLTNLFIPVPAVNYAMGEEIADDKENNWLLDEHYLFHFDKQIVDGKLLIEISIKHTNPSDSSFTIEYNENGFLAHHATLSKQSSITKFICDPDNCDPDNPTELIIKDSDNKELHRLNLTPDASTKIS